MCFIGSVFKGLFEVFLIIMVLVIIMVMVVMVLVIIMVMVVMVLVMVMVMVLILTANIEGDGVADAVPLKVVGDAGVDAGLLSLHPLQDKALVRHDQTSAHICYQGAALHMEIQ